MPASVAATDIWKSYPGNNGTPLSIMEGISIAAAEGEFVALVGPSGCGKSTLLNMLVGFERPDRGSITVNGAAIAGPSPRGVLITQKGSVFPWLSARRNLTFVLNGVDHKEQIRLAREYLELVGLEAFGLSKPYQLSGGMLQRLEVARALVVKPDVLYMDEPFGALDALTRLRMRTELLRILSRERHTTILVTHDVEEAIALADRVIVFSARPMRIVAEVAIRQPHPRSMASAETVALRQRILAALGLSLDEEVAAGQDRQPIDHIA